MASVTSEPLRIERLPDGRRKLLRDLRVEVDGRKYTVKKGFTTDYSSIPFSLLIIIITIVSYLFEYGPAAILLLLLPPKWSRVDVAGVVHDSLYKSGEIGKIKSDWIWLKTAMSGKHHARWWQAYPSWFFGLAVFGYFAWFKHRLNDEKND